MIPVRSERICSVQRALKCARREFKLYYIYRGILCKTLRFFSKFRLCVKMLQAAVQCKSVNECSEVK